MLSDVAGEALSFGLASSFGLVFVELLVVLFSFGVGVKQKIHPFRNPVHTHGKVNLVQGSCAWFLFAERSIKLCLRRF